MFTTLETHTTAILLLLKQFFFASVPTIKKGVLNLTGLRTAALHDLNFIQTSSLVNSLASISAPFSHTPSV